MTQTNSNKEKIIPIDVQRIKELIPHRYPFLLVDLIKSLVPYESAVGIKNVSINIKQSGVLGTKRLSK